MLASMPVCLEGGLRLGIGSLLLPRRICTLVLEFLFNKHHEFHIFIVFSASAIFILA